MKTLVAALAAWIVTLGVPVLLVLGSVRLVMTPLYLSFEYHRPDMTADFYGFTLEDRLRWGPLGIEYLLTNAEITLLGDLRFDTGGALFTARELGHMADVKNVTTIAFSVLAGAVLLVPLAALVLHYMRRWTQLRNAVLRGAVFTLGAITLIVFGAIVAWDTFFTMFHRAFFADGTWVFYTSDTLIRLYPEKFWFDAAITIGVLVTGGAFAIIGLCVWTWRRRIRADEIEPAGEPT